MLREPFVNGPAVPSLCDALEVSEVFLGVPGEICGTLVGVTGFPSIDF
jgi:hypothetical protein